MDHWCTAFRRKAASFRFVSPIAELTPSMHGNCFTLIDYVTAHDGPGGSVEGAAAPLADGEIGRQAERIARRVALA